MVDIGARSDPNLRDAVRCAHGSDQPKARIGELGLSTAPIFSSFFGDELLRVQAPHCSHVGVGYTVLLRWGPASDGNHYASAEFLGARLSGLAIEAQPDRREGSEGEGGDCESQNVLLRRISLRPSQGGAGCVWRVALRANKLRDSAGCSIWTEARFVGWW